ncbi:MAG TPA: 3-isopropylmalate dehydratase small subunit [SAR86 cluster bacterium]|nr:3-isopropylmalate dehydratase small subunit [SAR86 cluster bacterium]|tara:strand:- start:21524 stop:22168 length:645 start_codon:yes stop_codon:yes gene_type:complete
MKNQYIFHSGRIIPLSRDNVDTDQIIPKQFLKSIKKSGFGPNLFDAWRYEDEGYPGQDNNNRSLKEDFVLNQDKYAGADILISRKNFGCGSSREHAVWSLMDYGFKVVIAESFADIFYNNCFNNGLLPIKLPENIIEDLFLLSEENKEIEVDLIEQIILCGGKKLTDFDIDPFRKQCILEGLDEIGLSLKYSEEIKQYELKREKEAPWIFNTDE